MASLEAVKSQVMFQLSELSARNEHHAFERLCMAFARERISANILPATGPVSSGGDQGRDFETFRTYLQTLPFKESAFLGRISKETIVFTCSVQKRGIAGKVTSDVAMIMKSGTRPDRIYFFTPHDFPVSKRHTLQQRIMQDFGVPLEIFDGWALSEHLADPDLFWVAEQFLNVPSEVYPRRPEDEQSQWYSQVRSRWSGREPITFNFAEFEEIRSALRHASRTEELRGDVALWSEKLGKIRATISTAEGLWRRATYELIVSNLYAFGVLRGQEDQIRSYFESVLASTDLATVEDATALLLFSVGTVRRQGVDLTSAELQTWHEHLTQKVDLLLGASDSPAARCSLLEFRGSLALFAAAEGMPDVDGALTAWSELLRVAEKTPLYPLESFSDLVNRIVVVVGRHPLYKGLIGRLDKMVGDRYGQSHAAEKARERAVTWATEGNLLHAINELHVAKIKWFSEETLEGTILSLLVIAGWYRDLGLAFAAKQYALAGAHLAMHSPGGKMLRRVPDGLLAATEIEYSVGNTLGFLHMAGVSGRLLAQLGPTDPKERTRKMNPLVYDASLTLLFTRRFENAIFGSMTIDLLRFLGFEDAETELLPIAEKAWPDRASLWKAIQEQLWGHPFGDAMAMRDVRWKALGIEWCVRFENKYETVLAAEEMCALLQVLQADLAFDDLCLLPTTVTIEVRVNESEKPTAQPGLSNEGRRWEVVLPKTPQGASPGGQYETDLMAVAFSIVREVSVAPDRHFERVVKRMFKDGLSAKTFVGRDYRTLVREWVPLEDFVKYPRDMTSLLATPLHFAPREQQELRWRTDAGYGYDEKKSLEGVRRRYVRSIKAVRLTVRRLADDPGFQAIVAKLKDEGWKDWHILMAVLGRALNSRVTRSGIHLSQEAIKSHTAALMNREERPDDPVLPASIFTEEALRFQIRMNMLSSMAVFGLALYQQTPDFPALERLLVDRYRYKIDDVPHEPVFQAV